MKILIILVTTDGSVQNRVFNATEDYPQDSLNTAANYFNQYYSGLDFSMMSDYLRQEIKELRTDIAALMQATLTLAPDNPQDVDNAYVMSGQKNLLDFALNITTMQKLFDFFEQKTALAKILDDARHAEGVQIYIGGESDSELLEGVSIVAASYQIEGQIVGTLGVLGPTRMNYEKIVPIVDITAKLLSSALSNS
jgi:heat-inducible transcriptional repressor